MRLRRLPFAALIVTAAACSDSTALDRVDSVRVSPSNANIDVGLTLQFTAEALDANGTVVQGIDFTWESSNTDVATVTDDGLASALATGVTSITATAVAGKAGSQPLVVEPSACDSRIDVVLDPGQHQAYDGDTCLFLPSGDGDRYRVAVVRPTLIEDDQDTPDVWLEINPLLTTEQTAGTEPVTLSSVEPAAYSTRSITFDAADRIDGTRLVRDQRILDRTRRFHVELRERERELGIRTTPIPGAESSPTSEPSLTSGPALVDPPATDDFFLELDCTATTATPVTLLDFNDFIAIYQDSASHAASPVSASATSDMLSYYASYVADFTDQYWGQTPDIDANGRVIVSTAPALADSVAAAVFSGDFRSTTDCAASNEGEIIYFSETVMRNLDPANSEDESFLALSVLAHEMKHVTSLFHSVARQSFHNIWIEEGTAEIAQTMSSRIAWADVGGPALGTEITGNDIIEWNNSNNGIGPEAWGVVLQLADLVVQLSTQPNSLITNPEGAAEFHTFYAGGWHWHRFIGDAFGNASTARADSALFREMTDSLTSSGTGALLAVTGRTFEQLFEDVVVAASFHDAGSTPTRSFTTWDLHTATAIFAGPAELAPPHDYPWPITTDLQGNVVHDFSRGIFSCPPEIVGEEYQLPADTDRCAMGPSGIRFHDFVSDGSGAGAQVQVFGAPNGTLIVTRIN